MILHRIYIHDISDRDQPNGWHVIGAVFVPHSRSEIGMCMRKLMALDSSYESPVENFMLSMGQYVHEKSCEINYCGYGFLPTSYNLPKSGNFPHHISAPC
jgi:hypothetical protein